MSYPQQFCTFYLDNHLFGVPVLKVQEVLRSQAMTLVPLAPSVVRGLLNLRGQIVTAIDLRRRLHMPDRPEGQEPISVVLKSGEGVVSLLVDEIGDVVEVSDETYERPPETLSGVARELVKGVYKLEKGLLLTFDTDRVLNWSSEGAKAQAA